MNFVELCQKETLFKGHLTNFQPKATISLRLALVYVYIECNFFMIRLNHMSEGHKSEGEANYYQSQARMMKHEGYIQPLMPDLGTNPAEGLFFARFKYTRDSPTPRQSDITAFSIQRRESINAECERCLFGNFWVCSKVGFVLFLYKASSCVRKPKFSKQYENSDLCTF